MVEMPSGKQIDIPIMLDGRIVIVSGRDFEWNHALYCWQCSEEELAKIIACRALNLEVPKELANLRIVMYPDLGREHVRFIVNGQRFDFSLYGLEPVVLVPDF